MQRYATAPHDVGLKYFLTADKLSAKTDLIIRCDMAIYKAKRSNDFRKKQ